MGAALKRSWRLRIFAWLLALASGAGASEASQPTRVISLLPSATEAVCILGACDRLIGVDVFSQYPAQVKTLPQLGKTWQPDLERIVQLKPHVVFMGNNAPAQHRLESLGLQVVNVEAVTLQDIQRMLSLVDRSLQVQRADRVWSEIQGRLDAVVSSVRKTSMQPQRVYLEVDAALYAAGPHSYLGQLLAMLGANNIAPEVGNAFPRLSPEYIIRSAPDLIIKTHSGKLTDLDGIPGFSSVPAARNGRICTLDAHDRLIVTRPGPRVDEAAAILARCMNMEFSKKHHEKQ